MGHRIYSQDECISALESDIADMNAKARELLRCIEQLPYIESTQLRHIKSLAKKLCQNKGE